MANFFSRFQKNQNKRSARPEHMRRRREDLDPEDYDERIRRRRRRRIQRLLVILTFLILASVIVVLYIERKTYHSYKIIESSEQEDVVSTRYWEMDSKFLKYSPDEVSLVTRELDTVWTNTHAMQNPIADVRGKRAVVADKDGTTLEMYNEKGLTGSATTPYAIVKARVSSRGMAAVILDSGEDTWINYYASDGSLIAENQTKIDEPGYPMDVAISNDGLIMMVTYQFVEGSETTSYVAFYNFGDVGQNEDDQIVSGYQYPGILIPQVEYLGGTHSVALREDGLVIYEGKQIPKENASVHVDKEIVSTFYDDDTVGMVFRNEDKTKLYTMKVYGVDGKLKFTKDFNIPYTSIRISDGSVLMFNNSQLCVVSRNGVEKFNGTVDGTIKDFFKIGWNRYLLVLDSGINVIKLS